MTPAGAEWCALYPTSRSTADLVEPFRSAVSAFLVELGRRRCTVRISATRRPSERAWLMHYAWEITRGGLAPDAVPPHDPPIPIEWTIPGARAMVATYGLAYRPSLTSRHIQGLAVDMAITGWPGTLPELYALGASYGVHKLVSDPPHWSSDGR